MLEHWEGLARTRGVPVATGVGEEIWMGDIEEVCAGIGWTFHGSLLDVGCGTGRLARYADGYHGVDIAPAMVAYCQAQGLTASLTVTPADLPDGEWDQGAMLSVMTHMDRENRREYLFALRTRVSELLVDILPGRNDGDIGRMTADADEFVADLAEAGFDIRATFERTARSGAVHRYYRCV